jgi:hypothetical protein
MLPDWTMGDVSGLRGMIFGDLGQNLAAAAGPRHNPKAFSFHFANILSQ